jgi:superfamily II DNA helicase RecQ
MLTLVRHFGDQEDSGEPCGICDVCAPRETVARRFRSPNALEADLTRRVLVALRDRDGQTNGQLYREVCPDDLSDRKSFERLLDAMSRAGLLAIRDDSFEKDGKTIHFQRATLTPAGFRGDSAALEGLELPDEMPKARVKRERTKLREQGKAPPRARRPAQGSLIPAAAPDLVSPEVFAALKAWRGSEAKRRRVPAFQILPDRTLAALAAERPRNEVDLLNVRGIGPKIVQKYGQELLRLVSPIKK